jgi:c-di-GMP-binding flagellar brake protein YcgR
LIEPPLCPRYNKKNLEIQAFSVILLCEGVESRRQQMGKNQRKDVDRICAEKRMNILFSVTDDNSVGNIPDTVRTKNISLGGMCVVSDSGINKGTVIAAEIILNDEGCERIKAYCEAKWSRKLDDSGIFESGFQFIGLREESEKHLKAFISKHIKN